MPERPTLVDFYKLRFMATSNHCLQSANRAMQNGMSEEIVLACLLHDTVQDLIKVDHGWWGAQMYEPYVSEKVSFAIRYHQALRFYEDKEHGYEYPDLYRRIFGSDYKPEPYIEATYKMVRNAQVVSGAAHGDGERSLRFRSEGEPDARSVSRHHRAKFQAAEGRPGIRQQPGGAHVALHRAAGFAAVEGRSLTSRFGRRYCSRAIAPITSAGFSNGTTCPACGIMTTSAPAMPRWNACA